MSTRRRVVSKYDDRLTRRQRRTLSRQHGPRVLATLDQSPARSVLAAPPSGAPRRGLVKRAKARLARRYVHRHLTRVGPAVVAVAVTVIVAAALFGFALGLVLAAERGDSAL